MPTIVGKGLASPLRLFLVGGLFLLLLAGWHGDALPTTRNLRTRLSSPGASKGLSVEDVGKCAEVVEGQKMELFRVFSEVLKGVHNVMLISLPNHSNKGDSAIYHAQAMLLASLGIRIHHECGMDQCHDAEMKLTVERWKDDHFAILFTGGGNIGDLYLGEQDLKIQVMKTFPQIRMHIFPQSLKFRFEDRIEEQRAALAGLTHPLNSIALRDVSSYEFARAHFDMPNLRIDLTPDIVFFIGFRPDLRELLAPPVPHDLLFFRRKDLEGSDWHWAGGAEDPQFPVPFVERLEAATELGGLSPLEGDWIDEGVDLTDEESGSGHAPSRAWRRFMIGAEWLSRSDFVILDRLHGHILSLVLGIPHILIDNSIGKLSDYYGTWTHECRLGTLVVEGADQAPTVIKIYQDWVKGGKISGRDYKR